MSTNPELGIIPTSHADLLERPLYGHLATLMPDGTPQVTPVWFHWDGERLRFTTTRNRQKGRNATSRPALALSIQDPDHPYRYLEVRGDVEAIDPDPDGLFFDFLAKRYGFDYVSPLVDFPRRVVITMRPMRTTSQ